MAITELNYLLYDNEYYVVESKFISMHDITAKTAQNWATKGKAECVILGKEKLYKINHMYVEKKAGRKKKVGRPKSK